MKSRVDNSAESRPMIVAMAALQSVFMLALLMLSAYDGGRQPLCGSRLAVSTGTTGVEPGAIGKPDGLRQLFAADQAGRSKARLIDPPDFSLCRTSCLTLPRYSADLSGQLAQLPLAGDGCCAFEARAPPATIA
ncbi:hypothetical protein [Rhizobium sp. FY34]|uniref:hypothetical protein n=1 Tax=Rhizobium sp. FY34 TaxID=2562309 RepID=UPI001485803F|nr:hypothetical protein [Rhizobium sp. FY34]